MYNENWDNTPKQSLDKMSSAFGSVKAQWKIFITSLKFNVFKSQTTFRSYQTQTPCSLEKTLTKQTICLFRFVDWLKFTFFFFANSSSLPSYPAVECLAFFCTAGLDVGANQLINQSGFASRLSFTHSVRNYSHHKLYIDLSEPQWVFLNLLLHLFSYGFMKKFIFLKSRMQHLPFKNWQTGWFWY